MIRTVQTNDIVENIKEMCIEANYFLSDDMCCLLYTSDAADEL